MIAAIYARKSTDQNLPDAEKSVTRQADANRHTDRPALVSASPAPGDRVPEVPGHD
jgi:hypothetical protein